MGTRKIRKGIRDPERAKRVESQEVTIQSTWPMELLPPFGSTAKLQDILLEEKQFFV